MPDVDDGPAENDQQHPQHNNPQQQEPILPYIDYIVRAYFGKVINQSYMVVFPNNRSYYLVCYLVYCDLYCGMVGCCLAKANM